MDTITEFRTGVILSDSEAELIRNLLHSDCLITLGWNDSDGEDKYWCFSTNHGSTLDVPESAVPITTYLPHSVVGREVNGVYVDCVYDVKSYKAIYHDWSNEVSDRKKEQVLPNAGSHLLGVFVKHPRLGVMLTWRRYEILPDILDVLEKDYVQGVFMFRSDDNMTYTEKDTRECPMDFPATRDGFRAMQKFVYDKCKEKA